MTLIERLNKELSQYELEFKSKRECNDKYKGVIIDKYRMVEVPYELHKSTQINMLKSHCKWINDYVNMYVKLKSMEEKKQ